MAGLRGPGNARGEERAEEHPALPQQCRVCQAASAGFTRSFLNVCIEHSELTRKSISLVWLCARFVFTSLYDDIILV